MRVRATPSPLTCIAFNLDPARAQIRLTSCTLVRNGVALTASSLPIMQMWRVTETEVEEIVSPVVHPLKNWVKINVRPLTGVG